MSNHLTIPNVYTPEGAQEALTIFEEAFEAFGKDTSDPSRAYAMAILARLMNNMNRMLDETFKGPERWKMEAGIADIAMQLLSAVETPPWMR